MVKQKWSTGAWKLICDLTPYEVVYNQVPPLHFPYLPGESANEMVDRVFKVGDYVWLKLQAYRQQSVHRRANQKLAPKYFGPFKVLAEVGKAAYKLQLPHDAQIHDVFHVSQLKAVVGELSMITHLPTGSVPNASMPQRESATIFDKRMIKVQNKVQVQYLVAWKNAEASANSWEIAEDFVSRFPEFMQQYE
ncbi:hypothetical protein AgCh_037223 [Apium graveolens]